MTGAVLRSGSWWCCSYREVVAVYTRAGGSYVVARENFGPRVAQIAAVALLIDYMVTVAVQTAAGSAAIVSAFPQLGQVPFLGDAGMLLVISVVVDPAHVLRQPAWHPRGRAARSRCRPTCSPASVGLMIVVGLIRDAVGSLPGGSTPATLQRLLREPGHRPADPWAGVHPAARVRQRRLLADRDRGGRPTRSARCGRRRAATPARCWSSRASILGLPDRRASPGWRTSPMPCRTPAALRRAVPGSQADLRRRLGWVLFYAVQAGPR